MKKIYQTPKTDSVQMIGHCAIMAASGGPLNIGGGSGIPGEME